MAKTVSDLTHTGQVNSFTGGLNTDLHPLVQPNDTLTDCINGTLITYNGNENMLQNDMGNYTLEGSELPDGFVPLGMKEHNGVVYIVSQNPITEEVQIGSYPSPSDVEIPEIESDISTQQINMTTTSATGNYTYSALANMLCLESQKVIPPITKFNVEVSLGDEYSITSDNSNVDFQHEQFCIEMSDGTMRNVELSIDGKVHTFDQKFTGTLCKKYELNQVTDFTQNVDFQAYAEPKTRIVGGDENNASSSKLTWQYPDPDISSIAITNKLSFDRIDYQPIGNDSVYVGVMYEIVYGDPKKMYFDINGEINENKNSLQYSYYTYKLLPLVQDQYTYDFEYIIDQSFWFPRPWDYHKTDNVVIVNADDSIVSPIQVNTYPILIHRVNDKDRSVLCYDNSKRSNEINILDIKGSRTYQYCYTGDKIYLNLDIFEKPSNDETATKTLNILDLQLDCSIFESSTLEFTWSERDKVWISDTFTHDSDVIFIRYEYLGSWYTVPLFLTVDYYKYITLKDTYNDFCLIPGNVLLYGGDELQYDFSDESTRKYVKVSGNKMYYLNNDLPSSIQYDKENSNTSYGDLECSTLTIKNVQDGPIKVELQMLVDDNWETIHTYKTEAVNNTAKIKNVPHKAYIAKCTPGEQMQYIKRVYLAKHGHAPFAFGNNKEKWLELLNEYASEDLKPYLQDLIKYGNWENKYSLILGKECGRHNPAVRMFYCDIFGENIKEDHYVDTDIEWLEKINKFDQLFMPTKLQSGCKTSWFKVFNRLVNTEEESVYLIDPQDWHGEDLTYTLALTGELPQLLNDYNAYVQDDGSSAIDKWLLYLYTHTFYFDEVTSNATTFINSSDPYELRVLIPFNELATINIKNIPFKLTSDNINSILNNVKTRCNNFYFIARGYCNYAINSLHSDLWSNVILAKESIAQDSQLIESYKNNNSLNPDEWKTTVFCDSFGGNWEVLSWFSLNSNDANNINIHDIIHNWMNNGKLAVQKENAEFFISSNGSRSGNLNLVGLPRICWDQGYEGSSYYQRYLKINEHLLESEYKLSPRFKQILIYETDN